jgi:hypothetical protein
LENKLIVVKLEKKIKIKRPLTQWITTMLTKRQHCVSTTVLFH